MSQQGRTFKNIGSVADLLTTDRMEWLSNASPRDLVDFTHSGATFLPSRSDPDLNRLLRGSARFDPQHIPNSVVTQTQNNYLAQEAEKRRQQDLMRMYLMQRG